MVKVKAIKKINNLKDGGVYKPGDVFERTVAEINEFEKNYGKGYIERINENKEDK